VNDRSSGFFSHPYVHLKTVIGNGVPAAVTANRTHHPTIDSDSPLLFFCLLPVLNEERRENARGYIHSDCGEWMGWDGGGKVRGRASTEAEQVSRAERETKQVLVKHLACHTMKENSVEL